jgi:hypothetical protein
VTLHLPERLRELADEGPLSLSPDGLWREGRRRHRRRLAAAVAVVGCLVAGTAALGVGSWRSTQPEPAAPPATEAGPMTIPDQLFNPSPWLPTTRTPGRLVALFSSTRDHFPFGSDRNAMVGVAAGSQTYRFLDLPGLAPNYPDAYLSPDGNHLAYVINGTPEGSARIGDQSIIGLAVLDLTSGEVQRYVVPTAHGLAGATLTWVGSSQVALTSDVLTSSEPTSYAGRTRTYLFTLGSQARSVLPHSNVLDIPVTSTGGGFAGMIEKSVLRSYDPESRRDVTLSDRVTSVAYDAQQGLVAATKGNVDASGPTSGELVVGRVVDGDVHFQVVPGERRYDQALAWVDRTHVATMRQTRTGLVYDVVDVRTGDRRQLTSKPWYGFQVATDALQHATTVPGTTPPQPWDPRWVALGGLVAFVCIGGVVLVVWRRRGLA